MPRATRGAFRAVLVTVLATHLSAASAPAQERVRLRTNATLYGDNTEFFNPFRDGETLLGTAATMVLDVDLNDKVTFSGGLFVNHRFGSEDFAETVRPVFALRLRGDHQEFVFGTLDTNDRLADLGLDETGPHGLLAPLQNETVAFTRPYEAGLQWTANYPGFRQDWWINWQDLNTSEHRERFDVGLNGRVALGASSALSLAYQLHVVHEGGQLFASGPVSDSWAAGPGLVFEPSLPFFDRTVIEGYAMFSRYVPRRDDLNDARHGHGVFARLSGEKNGWRGHFIFWGACDWIKDEGDENYGSLREDGTLFRNTRHYGELGLTKRFYTADGVEVEGSARMHRVEQDYDYSYRVLARVGFDFLVWQRR